METLENLTELQRLVLAAVAILAAPTGCTARLVRAALVTAGARTERGLSVTAVEADLHVLAAAGWVVRRRVSFGYAVDEDRFPAVLQAVGGLPLDGIAAELQDTRGPFPQTAVGRLRVAIARGDRAAAQATLAALAPRRVGSSPAQRQRFSDFLLFSLGSAGPASWLTLLGDHADTYVAVALEASLTLLTTVSDAVVDAALAGPPWNRAHGIALLLFRGDGARGEAALAEWPTGTTAATRRQSAQAFAMARGVLAVGRGAWADAQARFQEMDLSNKEVALIVRGLARLVEIARAPLDELASIETSSALGREFSEEPAIAYGLTDLFRARAGREPRNVRSAQRTWLSALLPLLVQRWCSPTRRFAAYEGPPALRATTYRWVAAQLESAIGDAPASSTALLHVRDALPAWEAKLDALALAVTGAATKEGPAPWIRWVVGPSGFGEIRIRVRVMGRSTGGREERLTNVASGEFPARDVAIARALLETVPRRESDPTRFPVSALRLLVGDEAGAGPEVWDERGPLRVVREAPTIRVRRGASGDAHVSICCGDALVDGWSVLPIREPKRGERLRELPLLEQTPASARVAAILGRDGLPVPAAGLPRLLGVLSAASASFVIESEAASVEDVLTTAPYIELFRTPRGLRARLRIIPFAGAPPLRPGEPPEVILRAAPDGRGALESVTRDLAAERRDLQALFARCPLLEALPRAGEDRVANELEVAFALLMELRAAGATVSWPEGVPLRLLTAPAGARLSVRATSGVDWFALDGELPVTDDHVLRMTDLLAHASKGRGRFVPLDDDAFVALTEDTLRKLEELARAQELGNGRFSKALLPAVEEWLDGADVSWDAGLSATRAAIAKAEVKAPAPRLLRAELRDYQLAGFQFLARRTGARLGAFLADDMGLGKTVQAIALLAHRAKDGPALVIAPTSVLRGWAEELARFAPGLRVLPLTAASSPEERAEAVEHATKRDVLLISYGILAREEARFTARAFHTVIFDEAHALKNPGTRRWEAARALNAGAKVALSGTPVENRIAELHAVFELLMPGMLGPRANFERLFATRFEDEADDDGATRAQEIRRARLRTLRSIVRPFVLRRTKGEVLAELPAKTEITRLVPTSTEHRAYYEALRRRSVAEAEEGGPGRPMRVLAAITRLRRAAIDPRLDGGDGAPPGGKLDALLQLVEEIRSEGHRALVFSQFLEVLDRAGEALTGANISFQRLDGGMTAGARAAAVEAFQAGEGDVFLLSLKAGGVGMNLTAADYVIHLDPWWNPAVEDQASDRAHRIGQRRPVTIVRLVAEGTIEEQVLALHGVKRALFAEAIGDADGAGALDVNALRELLTSPP